MSLLFGDEINSLFVFFLQNHNLLKNLHCLKHNFHRYKVNFKCTNIYKRVSQGDKSLIIRKHWSCDIFNIFLTMYSMYTLCGYSAFP